jgi:hypothetical protein
VATVRRGHETDVGRGVVPSIDYASIRPSGLMTRPAAYALFATTGYVRTREHVELRRPPE